MARGALTAARTDVLTATVKVSQQSIDALRSEPVTLAIQPSLRQVGHLLFMQYQVSSSDVTAWTPPCSLTAWLATFAFNTLATVNENGVLLLDAFALAMTTSGMTTVETVREVAPGQQLPIINPTIYAHVDSEGTGQTNTAYFKIGYQVVTLPEQQYLSAQVAACC